MNIIMLIVDTLRYDYIAANGNSEIETPNFDRFIKKSWNFHRAFANSYPTIPHRTDVMTGRYGVPFNLWKPLDCDVMTIPGKLAEEGYCTQLLHDTPHLVNGGHNFDYPFHAWTPIRGQEVDRAWITDSWDFMDNWEFDPLFDDFYPRDKKEILHINRALATYSHTNKGRKHEEEWSTPRLFKKASQFLRDNSTRNNFFLWIDSFEPHGPWDTPPEFVKKYDTTTGYNGTIDPRALCAKVTKDLNLPEKVKNRVKAMYAATVTFLDKWVGVFLDTLEETGLDKDTVVLITADHGTNVADSKYKPFGKTGWITENEGHVPFIIYGPEIGSGESTLIIQPQDIFATLMGLIGKEVPSDIDSYDIFEQLQNKNRARRIAITGANVSSWKEVLGLENVLFSVFDHEWRLGYTADPRNSELMHLGSREDVADEYPEVVKELRELALGELEKRNLDPVVLNWLKSEGKIEFPDDFKVNAGHKPPEGWKAYFSNIYLGE